MTFPFEIIEHTIPSQHIREWPRATSVSQEDVLQIRIKQYRPVDNPHPQPGDVTVIGAHANGFPKEVYEPLWADLHAASQEHGFRIRGIWVADMAHQGQSGLLNGDRLGDDPSLYDHARDLLHMTNVFCAEMPQPLVGIGHSFGGNALASLALMHPRLLSALVLLDPVIHKSLPTLATAVEMTRLSASRRDTWPSREAAAASFRRARHYSTWDPRALDAWIEHGIREVPEEGPAGGVRGAALVTSRHQEVFTYFRPLYPHVRADGTVDRDGAPDFDPAADGPHRTFPFYRAEGPAMLARLPHVRPAVLWVYGGASGVWWGETTRTCGTGVDGSGGVAAGRVAEVVLGGRGHLFPMEVPGLCAEHAAAWVGRAARRHREGERRYRAWAALPTREKTTLSTQYLQSLGRPAGQVKKGPGAPASPKL
ncbi:prolyl aminopeptidase-like protein [Xylaria palmicola]|nr:prolyl aminopeptidase-like protein [Xylaria palmicola]